MEKLQGKVAIVTGASKGIGAGIAKAFAAAGAEVIVNYAGSKEGADLVVSEIMENGGRAAAIQANVSKEADVKRFRIGQPEDIARAAVFLASDEAAWITGDTILVSGGLL